MSHFARHVFLLFLLLPLAGCGDQDKPALASIGRKLGQRAEMAVSQAQVARLGPLEKVGVDARVAARLQWDKSLDGCTIQVKGTGGKIELSGAVREASQKTRALDLTYSTVGVEEVIDSLTATKDE